MTGAAWLLAALQLAGLQDDLAACRRIDAASERLACYDQLTQAPPAPPQPAARPAPTPEPPPPPAAKAADEFGAEALPTPKAEAPARIEARLVGTHDGWRKGTRFTLDNGQVWACIDDHEGFDLLEGNPVTIVRNRLGSYWMHVDRVAGDIRVRRER